MDKYWQQALSEIKILSDPKEPIIAPLQFQNHGLNIYDETTTLEEIDRFSLVVIHKGDMEKYSSELLAYLAEEFHVQFANEVFVIFGSEKKEENRELSLHVKPFFRKLKNMISGAHENIAHFKNRQTIYLGNNRALTRTVYGHKMLLDTRDLSLAPHILMDGEWEPWITKVFLNLLRPGMKVIDIGSNVGFYSILAADKIGKNGYLVCFEANPDLADLVFYNLQINGFHGRSKVISKAVYSHSDTLKFKIFQKYLGSSSIWADEKHAAAFHDSLKTITVDAISLDEYVPTGIKVDFIKMDAEGAEPYILKGANRIIKENPDIIILMEFSPPILKISYGSIEKFYSSISSLGLNIYKINLDSSLSPLHLPEAKDILGIDVVLRR